MKKNLQILFATAISCVTVQIAVGQSATATISTKSNLTISKHIYGQFAEHLGRGIYDGFWVDKNLPVKKQDRI